jgi:hypothetical protein
LRKLLGIVTLDASALVGMRTYTTFDKSSWGPGPWQGEPDKLSWTDPGSGLPCLIVRNRLGALCGYVGVAPEHPWHGIPYNHRLGDDEPQEIISVHGGLTFSDGCDDDGDEATAICHIAEPGQPDHVWWFGFDCSHGFDFVPGLLAREAAMGMPPDDRGTYRDVEYVKTQIESLALQLVAVA